MYNFIPYPLKVKFIKEWEWLSMGVVYKYEVGDVTDDLPHRNLVAVIRNGYAVPVEVDEETVKGRHLVESAIVKPSEEEIKATIEPKAEKVTPPKRKKNFGRKSKV